MPPSMRASMPPEVPMYVLPEPSRMRHTACSDRHRQTDTDRRFRTRVGGEHKLDGVRHRHCMYTHTGFVPTDCVLPILLSLSLSLSVLPKHSLCLCLFLSGYTYIQTDRRCGKGSMRARAHTCVYKQRETGRCTDATPHERQHLLMEHCAVFFYFFYCFYYYHLFVYILLLVRR